MSTKSITSFLALGIVSVIVQVVLQRELINDFYGNEVFIGIVLASWLAWTAAGSGMAARSPDKVQAIASFALLALLLDIVAIRLLKAHLGFPGEIPDLVSGMAAALLMPAPIGLLLGMWWRAGTQPFPAGVTTAYFVETTGFLLGGILFSVLLVAWQEFSLAALLFIVVSALCARTCTAATGIMISIAIALMLSPLLPQLNRMTIAARYSGQELIETTNTRYGNIAVTKIGHLYALFENSVPLGTTEKVPAEEELAHLSLLQHPSPKNVLLIGGGFTRIVQELLQHPVERLDVVELDPELIRTAEKYVAFSDPRLHTTLSDGRYFLQTTDQTFDAIILHLPPPSTALLNRYYTKEFFDIATSKLAPNGIFVTALPSSPSAPSRTLRKLQASVWKALREAFPETIVLPDETILFLSSTGGGLTYDPRVLLQRFAERTIRADYISEGYITYRMTTDRIPQTLASLEEGAAATTNRDLVPVAAFYQNLFWLDLFSPRLSAVFEPVAGAFGLVFAAALVLAIVILRRSPPLASVGIAGFSLMSLEMVVVFLYQTFVGYLYDRIALLISALMLGMACGVLVGRRSRSPSRYHAGIILFCGAIPVLLAHAASESMIILMAVLSGFLCAALFPIATALSPTRNTGTVYGVDLLGSCLGALLPSVIVIPVFGVHRMLAFIALANLAALLVWLVTSWHRSTREPFSGG